MSFRQPKVPPPGRSATRWFLFLVFYHLLPLVWYMAVAGGFAPGSFLLAGGLASLFSGDSDGFAMALFLLAPALLGGLLFYLLSWLLAVLIGRLTKPLARTLLLLAIFAACLSAALQPIFISGGHGSSHAYGLLDFVTVLGEFRVPANLVRGYFAVLTLLLAGLLVVQQLAARRQALSEQQWLRRRRLRRRALLAAVLILLVSLGWTHRTLLLVKPLADLGFASAQYRLAMVLKEESIQRHGRPGGGYQDWLVKAAEQGHLKAAEELVRHPRNREEKLRWLTVAADGGMTDAQLQLYHELLSSTAGVVSHHSATYWLQTAAAHGQAEAQFELGRAYLGNRPQLGLARNPGQARSWWERAAASGHLQAMRELAWRYEQGADGFPRRAERAIELHRQLAAAYRAGTGQVRPDPQRAAS